MSAPVRILFVEDSPDDVELVLHELRRGGFTPDHWVVETAEAMRQALADESWDLVVAGHPLRRFDAPRALAVLQESGQDLPFVVVSGHIGEEQAVACMRAGASDYLIRDDLARLVPVVERELREAGRRRQSRETQAALDISEERCRLMVENSADVIALLDGERRVTFVSPSVSRVLGYPPAEVVGQRLRDFLHGEDAGALDSALDSALAHGSAPLFTGLRFRRQDGGWRVVEGSAARLVQADGTISFVVTALDITERIQLEEQLHQAQKMEAIGRLAGGVAHDFNNLVTVILGYANLLLDQLGDDHVLHEEVEEVKRAADRAATLTRQLLSLSRRQVLSQHPVDLNGVLGALAEMLGRLIGEDVELELRRATDLGRTRVDPGQVEQIVLNLAVNARDAMPHGGRLLIETANVDLDLARARRHNLQPGAYVMLMVRDTGHGMDAATQARLFEPFFTTKEPGKGTGLGLSTIYGIVRQGGGAIAVESEPERGSTFRIYLPRVREEAVAPPGGAAPTAARGGESVLLVEDESMVKSLMSEVLRRSGYRVMEYANGREALARVRHYTGSIHVLVTDVVMPGMNGIELARELALGRPDMRILLLSGYADEVVTRQGLPPAGAVFLQKPFTPDTLLRRVRELLDQPTAEEAGGIAPPGPPGG